MSTPDPQTVREIAAKVADIALHDAVHVDQWISAVIDSDFGNECSQVRAPLHTAVARRMATVRPSWPDEQQTADPVSGEQQDGAVGATPAGFPADRLGAWLDVVSRRRPPPMPPSLLADAREILAENKILTEHLIECPSMAAEAAGEQQQDGAAGRVEASTTPRRGDERGRERG